MQTAHAWVKINELNDNVQFKHITPAEALIARKQFGVKTAGQAKPISPITHLDVHTKEVERTKDQEYTRLVKKYGSKMIETVFPGENPNIPMKFSDIEGISEQVKGKAPESGEAMEVVPLSSMSKEETTDAESVKEGEARKAQADLIVKQGEQIAKLGGQLEALLKIVSANNTPVQQQVQQPTVKV